MKRVFIGVALASGIGAALGYGVAASAESSPPWSCYNPDTYPTAIGSEARRWGSVQKLETTLNAAAPAATPKDILVVSGMGVQSMDTVICVRSGG